VTKASVVISNIVYTVCLLYCNKKKQLKYSATVLIHDAMEANGVCTCSSTDSLTPHYMDVTGQLYSGTHRKETVCPNSSLAQPAA
jgi:hypothetical protein